MSRSSDTFPELAGIYAEGLCTDLPTEIFFTDEEDEDHLEKLAYAREVCEDCPVLYECQTHALAHEEFGFWGGLTEKERRSTRRRRSNR